MVIRSLLLASLLLLLSCKDKSPRWPDINKEMRPWTRWWWHGSALTKEGITAELEAYHKAGIGGVEITPIYGVKGYEDKFVQYLSPEWMELFTHTLAEAKRLKMGVDMATGTGWPFGGPWVTEEYASRNFVYKTYRLEATQLLEEKIEYIERPYLRTVLPGNVDIKDIKQPINKNTNLQQLAIDQIKFERKLPLILLMAYSDNGEILDVADRLDEDGHLNWSPSRGSWKLYAMFEGWHGKMVERAGPGGEGNVIDHFSSTALDEYLDRFDSAFRDKNIDGLRAFFNDSYEVDDARGAADWTPGFFEEFEYRRGYRLQEHLPALLDSAHNYNNSKLVLYDYRQTISELLGANFTEQWRWWAWDKGKIIRNQAHGSPANILDLYAKVDIPEIEGTEPLRIRMASSAANVNGKSLVSAEAATWLDEHFESDLGDVKGAVDRFFLNGVNHIFYHGTSYSPPGEPWPGWLFYAAVHLNPRNPQWADFDVLNNYVARCQSLLQTSKGDNDILVYYPIADPMSKFGPEMIEHFDGIGRQFAGSNFEKVATGLLEKGYTFDFISDTQLETLVYEDQKFFTDYGAEYKMIIVPASEYIPFATMVQLNRFAREGGNVVMVGGKPTSYAGLNDGRKKTMSINSRIVMLDSIDSSIKVKRETMIDEGLEFTRRKMDDGTIIYFIRNTGNDFDGMVTLNKSEGQTLLYDPMTGVIGIAGKQGEKVRLQLAKGQSIIVTVGEPNEKARPFTYVDTTGEPVILNTKWTITFEAGGPVLPAPIETDTLGSWTNYGKEYRNFAGTVVYKTHLKLPDNRAEGWILDLGDVRESARVVLNGKEIAALIAPPFRVKIEQPMAQPDNVLEVRITNLMANRIADLDRNGIPWKKFYNINLPARKAENRKDGLFDASKWDSRPSGMMRPVQLLSCRKSG